MLDKEVTMAFLAEYEALARKYQLVIIKDVMNPSELALVVAKADHAPNYISSHLKQLRENAS